MTLAELCGATGINLMSVNPNIAAKVGMADWVLFSQDNLGVWVKRYFRGMGFTETIMVTPPQFVALRLVGIQLDAHYRTDCPV